MEWSSPGTTTSCAGTPAAPSASTKRRDCPSGTTSRSACPTKTSTIRRGSGRLAGTLLAATLVATACGSGTGQVAPPTRDIRPAGAGDRAVLSGSGSTFVEPLVREWISRYRALAAKKLGTSCPIGVIPPGADELAATLQDWLNEIERIQLLLRLSGRLRQLHGD